MHNASDRYPYICLHHTGLLECDATCMDIYGIVIDVGVGEGCSSIQLKGIETSALLRPYLSNATCQRLALLDPEPVEARLVTKMIGAQAHRLCLPDQVKAIFAYL